MKRNLGFNIKKFCRNLEKYLEFIYTLKKLIGQIKEVENSIFPFWVIFLKKKFYFNV